MQTPSFLYFQTRSIRILSHLPQSNINCGPSSEGWSSKNQTFPFPNQQPQTEVLYNLTYKSEVMCSLGPSTEIFIIGIGKLLSQSINWCIRWLLQIVLPWLKVDQRKEWVDDLAIKVILLRSRLYSEIWRMVVAMYTDKGSLECQ